MDSDHGTESARASGSTAHRMSVITYDDLLDVYEYLKNEDHPYQWVWWDSLTLFQDRTLIDEVMVDAHAANPNQEEFVPSRREYLINMNRVGRMVRNFVELPINFGITAHVLETVDAEDNSKIFMPAIQGKGMPSKVAGYMNVVGFYGAATVEERPVRRLLTQRFGKFYARDRFGALGAYMDDPTIPRIEAKIAAKRAADKERAAGNAAPASPRRRRKPAATPSTES